MTRVTNFGRKRTYVQAGFDNELETQEPSSTSAGGQQADASGKTSQDPETKKRKRIRSKKTKLSDTEAKAAHKVANEGDNTEGGECVEQVEGGPERSTKKDRYDDKEKKRNQVDKRRSKDSNARKSASEQRRLKRIDHRHSETICFACREKGHTARDCTNSIAADALGGEPGKSKSGRDTVGICYRCGSRRHTLSRCKEPVNPESPLPFASCFVCSGKGHLASKCPKNQSKGIYPNGGCCKVCKETTHLAKDCPMRKPDVAATTVFVGTGQEGGADEDDFHTFKRRTLEVDKAEKIEERVKRKAEVKVAAHSGVVRAFGSSAPAATKKRVVFF
ncbi:hypothetical protein BD311DRAFT_751359 [Dichomitus squalens]|uniref:CCHC-type domain-containing protein n=1 Tax=Dichomitus squalens TaxID=114155 RepID=A0A4Q9MZA4_9APHY|nr:hypothetical protein BD311DRAFT_751359 [Dichomitus squalens]